MIETTNGTRNVVAQAIRRMSVLLVVVILLGASAWAAEDIQRFDLPQFDSGYTLPATPIPPQRHWYWNYLDVGALLFALSLTAYLVYVKRSRRGLFWMAVASLAYFGFYREGCVCPIGAIQNVTLGVFDSGYGVSWVVLAFFLLPLVFALFFGRVFCASVCPLGAIQEVFTLRPLRVVGWLKQTLGIIPHLYLGLAVLFAATGTGFIICEYDPFIAIFRLTGTLNMLILGGCFIVIGLFVGRPYCRFFCPYGVLLSWCSQLSRRVLSIYPETCVTCHLCEDSCPYDCIRPADDHVAPEPAAVVKRRVLTYLLVLPILIGVGAVLMGQLGPTMARKNKIVKLAEEVKSLAANPKQNKNTDTLAAFYKSEESPEELFARADAKINDFIIGAWILGGFMGLVIGLRLVAYALPKRRDAYTVDAGHCYTCGRCYDHCPKELEYQDGLAGVALGESAKGRWILPVIGQNAASVNPSERT